MRHYERENFRHLQDAERYRDIDYLADDGWVGPNESVPHGLTTTDEPPWWTAGPWERRPFAAVRAFDEDRGQGREYGRDFGLGFGRDHDMQRAVERRRDDPYDRRVANARAYDWARVHSGRFVGPRQQRSDDAIYREVRDRLAEHAGAEADDISVEVRNGDVWLFGVVEDLRLRFLAEDIADDVAGVTVVRNRLRLRAVDDTRPGGSRQWNRRASSSVGGSRR